MDFDNQSTKTARSGGSVDSSGSGGSRRTMSLRRLFKPGKEAPLERQKSAATERLSILPLPTSNGLAEHRNNPSNISVPHRPFVGGVPSAFAGLGMASYVIPLNGLTPEAKPSPRIPTACEVPVMTEVKNLPVPVPAVAKPNTSSSPTPAESEAKISDYFEQSAGWSCVIGENIFEKRSSVAEGEGQYKTGFVLSYSSVEIDYINGHTIQAHTWRAGGITFIRLTPTTAPLPPLIVPYSCLEPDVLFSITIHLPTSTKKELLYIDSAIEYNTLLRKIGAHYKCSIVGEDGTSTIGLGFSTKTWNGPDTRKWAQKLETLEGPSDGDEEYIEMILSIDTAEKWAWCLGIARQALKVRGLTSREMRSVGVEMWLINEEGDNFQLTESS